MNTVLRRRHSSTFIAGDLFSHKAKGFIRKMFVMVVLLALVGVKSWGQVTTVTQYPPTTGNFTVPSGVSSITIECWGGGGGGGGSFGSNSNTTGSAGGGGGGGAYSKKTISVLAGQIYTITIGAGGTAGAAGANAGGTGGSTIVTGTGGTVTASGGAGGSGAPINTGAAAGVGGAIGTGYDAVYKGGNGSAGASDGVNETGGGGGGGAGNANAGGNASTSVDVASTGGTGGTGSPNTAPYIGATGAGSTATSSNSTGTDGSAPGGGASGGASYKTSKAGGTGGQGQVVITYTLTQVNFYSKSTGNLDVLATWGTNTDGSGTAPSSFTVAAQTFNIRNNAGPTIGAAWTVSGTGSNVVLGDGTNAVNFTVPATFAFTGTLNISNNATFTDANTTVPTFGTINANSTVNFASSSTQTIPAKSFGNLTSSSTGARTLASSGTTGVAGAFTPGTNTYTIIGSTIDFSSASAQTIPAFSYYNLTNSGNGARTFASSGNINIAGTSFSPGTGTYTVTGSTVQLNGSVALSLTVPTVASGFGFNILNATGSGTFTLPASASTQNLATALNISAGTFVLNPNTNSSIINIVSVGTINITGGTLDDQSGVSSVGTTLQISAAWNQTAGVVTNSGSGVDLIQFTGGGATTFKGLTATANFEYYGVQVSNNTTTTLLSALTITGVTGTVLTVDAGSTFNASTFVVTTSGAYTFLISGIFKTADLAGFSGTTASALSSTNTPTVTLSVGSTVEYNGSGAQTVSTRSDYSNLTIGDVTTPTNTNATPTATLTIGASVLINSSATFTGGTALTHNVAGNWTNNGTFAVATSTINLNGAAQTISGITSPSTFYNLTLAGSGTKTLGVVTAISGTETISNGVLENLGTYSSTANALTLNTTGQSAGTYGGTGSPATYILPTYFAANTGILTVGTSSCTPGTWIGYISTDWFTPGNWCGNVIPTSTTNVIIPATATNQPVIGAAGAVCNSISINGSLTISGTNGLAVSGSWLNAGTFTANNSTVTFNASSGTQTVNNLTQSFYNVTHSGAGTLQLVTNSLIASNSITNSAGTIDLAGKNLTTGDINGLGAITNSIVSTSVITTGSDNASTTYSGVISSGSATKITALTKTGTGILTLSGTNTYTGTTTLSGGGGISIGADANIGTGTLAISNASTLTTTGTVTMTRAISLTSGGGIFNLGGSFTSTGVISGGGGFTTGGSDFILSGSGTNAAGTISINSNRLFVFTTITNINGSTVNIANGATIDFGLGSGSVPVSNPLNFASGSCLANRGNSAATPTGTITVSSAIFPNAGTMIFNNDDQITTPIIATNSDALTGNLSIQVGGNNTTVGTVTLSGIITGGATAGLTKTLNGILIFSGLNTYTGSTTLTGGILKAGVATAGANGAFGNSSAITLANTSGVALDITGFNNTIGSLAGGGSTGGNVTLGVATLTTGTNNTSTTYSGVISGTGSIIKTGSGTLTLSGVNNYTGTTNIGAGILQIGAANAIPAVASAGAIILNGTTINENGTGFSDGNGGNPMGQLQLNNSTASALTLGTGTGNVLKFASGLGSGTGSLTINGWGGTAGSSNTTGAGGEIFIGSTASLTPAQLSQITFNGFTNGTMQLSTGEIVPVCTTVSNYAITPITGITPVTNSAYFGQTITIAGTGFLTTSTVTVGGVSATVVSETGGTQIVATVPAGATATGGILVTNPTCGNSSSLSFTPLGYISTTAGAWSTPGTWLNNAVPVSSSTSNVTIYANVTSTPTTTVGALNVLSGSTLAITGATTLTVSSSSADAGIIINAGTLTLNASPAYAVNGTLQLNSGGTISSAPNYGSTSTLVYNEGGVVNVGVEWPALLAAPTNITIQNSTTVAVGALTRVVEGVLTFTSGFITTTSGILDIYLNGSVTGAGTGGWVAGVVAKSTAAGASPTFTYPVGSDIINYTPLTLTFSGTTTTSGVVTVSTTGNDNSNISSSTINSARSVNRYWTVVNSSTNPISLSSGSNVKPSFTWVPGDVDAGTVIPGLIVGEYDGTSWTYPAVGTPTSTTLAVTGTTITTLTGGTNYVFQVGDATFAITSSAGANGTISPNGTTTVTYGGSQAYTITPNTGYHIATVLVDGTNNPTAVSSGTYTFTNITTSHTITATYAINTYTITVTQGANGTIAPGTTTVNYGGNQTFTITPTTGYHITDVSVDGASQGAVASYAFTNVTANHTITATYAINTYTITVTQGANGTIAPGTTTVNYGGNQTFTITPTTGYHITDVSVDGVSQGAVASYAFTNVTANHTITATYAINTYTITVTQGANGTIAPGTTTVNYGGNQTFTITPTTGYHITDVSVDGVSQGAVASYAFTNVTANHTITATYAINTYTITVTQGANGTIAPGTTTVNYGGNQTFTITPTTGYHITDVSVDGVSQGAVASYAFTNVTANHTITATYAINTYTITVTQGANGTIAPGTTTVNYGSNQTFTITPTGCNGIATVSVDGVNNPGAVSNGSYTFSNVTANHTITATFTPVPDTWIGTSSINWNDAGNWSCGVPAMFTDVIIQPATFNPQVTSASAAHNITIQSGGSLTVSDKLQISGTISTDPSGIFDVSTGTIELNGSTTQNIYSGTFTGNKIENLIISNNVTLNGADSLFGVLSFGATNNTFTTNDNLTLRSVALTTAAVDVIGSANAITGNVTVERYIATGSAPNHAKGWQLLAIPTSGSTYNNGQSIKDAWQEGASVTDVGNNTPGSAGNPVPGYGTMITSNRTTAIADGFDAYTSPGPSMKAFDTLTNDYDGPVSTTIPIFNKKGYFTFVRGDRSVTTFSGAPLPTILRTKGILFTPAHPPLATNIGTGKFESIGNPYAAPIDMRNITISSGVDSFFQVWDPRVGSSYNYGAFVTFLFDGTNYEVGTNGGGSYPANGTIFNYLQSGQAFFMQTAPGSPGTVTFSESAKAVNASFTSIFTRQASGARITSGSRVVSTLRTSLNTVNADGSTKDLVDGVLDQFDDSYSNAIDRLDARKMPNTGENLSIKTAGTLLVIERKHTVVQDDTIHLNLTNERVQQYRYHFEAQNMSTTAQGFVIDKYKQTSTPLNLGGTTDYDFSVENIAGSYAPDRFMIVFSPLKVLPVTFTSIKAYRQDKNIEVEWRVSNESNIKEYQAEKSVNGIDFTTLSVVKPTNNNGGSAVYVQPDTKPVTGDNYYRIRSIDMNGAISYTTIVKVTIADSRQDINIYPNPITDGQIHLQFLNEPVGKYGLRLLNSLGQVILSKQVTHADGTTTDLIRWNFNLAHGMYKLEVTQPDGTIKVINVLY